MMSIGKNFEGSLKKRLEVYLQCLYFIAKKFGITEVLKHKQKTNYMILETTDD